MPERYRYSPDDHHYQLCFGAETVITAVEGSKPPPGPQYIAIATIPRTVTADDRYDIIGVLIYFEPLRQLERPNGEPLYVRECVLIDNSTEQPLVVTAWGELATTEGAQLEELKTSFPVIGWTALKPSYHKGFSLSTTTSTFLQLTPTGDKAKMLRNWAEANRSGIAYRHNQMSEIRAPEKARVLTTIQALRAKKATNTLQEERHWLHVSSPDFDHRDVRVYLGCFGCGTGSKTSENVAFTCSTCKKQAPTAVPRMTVSFEAVDSDGSFMFTAFTSDAEKLMDAKAAELFSMEPEEWTKKLLDAECRIRGAKMYLQVGPSTALSRNGVLKWVLKQISLE